MRFQLGVLIGLVAAAQLQGPSQTLAPAEPAWNWLEEVRTAAFDDLMPITSAASLLAAYRTHRDLYHDVHERHFRIGVADGQSVAGDRLTAVVVVPANQSIQQQLLVLHAADPKASLKLLLSKVVVRQVELTVERCPAIRTRMDALSKLPITLPARTMLYLHPFVHRIVIDLPSARIDATISDEQNALVRWASETTDALLACSAG
jgi:hypothetical protein